MRKGMPACWAVGKAIPAYQSGEQEREEKRCRWPRSWLTPVTAVQWCTHHPALPTSSAAPVKQSDIRTLRLDASPLHPTTHGPAKVRLARVEFVISGGRQQQINNGSCVPGRPRQLQVRALAQKPPSLCTLLNSRPSPLSAACRPPEEFRVSLKVRQSSCRERDRGDGV